MTVQQYFVEGLVSYGSVCHTCKRSQISRSPGNVWGFSDYFQISVHKGSDEATTYFIIAESLRIIDIKKKKKKLTKLARERPKLYAYYLCAHAWDVKPELSLTHSLTYDVTKTSLY